MASQILILNLIDQQHSVFFRQPRFALGFRFWLESMIEVDEQDNNTEDIVKLLYFWVPCQG